MTDVTDVTVFQSRALILNEGEDLDYLRLACVVGQPRGCRIVAEVTDRNVIRDLAQTVMRKREQELCQDLRFLPVEAGSDG